MSDAADIHSAEREEKNEASDPKLAVEHLESNNLDYDAQRLHDLGYKQEFKRSLGMVVQFGFAFSTMAVTAEYSIGIGPALNAGGPVSMFYGWMLVSLFVSFIGLGMAEIVSGLPTAGGIYFWCYKLSNEKYGRFMAYMAGYVYLIGLITAGMTLAWGGAQFLVGIIGVNTGSYDASQGVYVGIYCAILICCTAVNYFGTKVTGVMNKFLILWTLIGTVIIVVAMPAMAPSHQPAKWVFTEFINNTGYENVGMVFLVGLLQAGWTMIGYETSVQIVEETKNADVAAPRGILLSIAGSWIQGTILIVAILFSVQDVDALTASPVPIAELFSSTTNRGMATFLMLILFIMQMGSLCNSMLANGHLMWSMARDGCIPFSKYFYQLSGDDHTPFRTIVFSTVCSIIVIMPSFGSVVFWQAIMSSAVIAINVAYGLPFFCRLMWSRNTLPKGPFSLGRASIPINAIALVWIAFFAVILCFPGISPVDPVSMNYASLMIGAVVIFALVFWMVNGRHHYRGPMQNVHE